ncbi:hypothetical protein ACX0G9_31180 [Flavitalea flava]
MSTTAKNNDRKKTLDMERRKKEVSFSNVPDLSTDPYFVKKTESAKQLLDKYGVPKNKK